MVSEYWYGLATIIRQSPNIQHVCVVSVESGDLSLWNYLIPPDEPTHKDKKIAGHGFPRLHTLVLQIHMKEDYGSAPSGASFSRMCCSLGSVPGLARLHASGVVSSPPPVLIHGDFKSLRHIEITECTTVLDQVDQLLEACNDLEHFACQWAFLDCSIDCPMDVLPGLLKHKETLVTLHLDLREVRFFSDLHHEIRFSSLPRLTAIREAKLDYTCLLDDYIVYSNSAVPSKGLHRTAPILPASLEHLTMLLTFRWPHDDSEYVDHLLVLYQLVKDVADLLPRLREVVVQYKNGKDDEVASSASAWAERFNGLGIRFSLVKEADSLT
ncbi:hypothetical protein BU26DRAFT_432360 [Trematosphaeria pertusa]|uniref:F-box domain-containing protein n=1 Tax=Trematosphaeria pertusa TaxID=390896 RepID=A0A6A6I7Q8_9PLEO|nr:uncharacterized protein BU26DRAFT_432360 [Trematosphaeria pertusa]KAF2246327.1 hypothetical protein BU26DRAFT_432360 [Trematosphaeria pertusa]